VPEVCIASTLDPYPGKPPGSVCREWNGSQPGWAVAGPLCETEVRVASRDVPLLLWDVLDLEQMIPRSLSQALDGQPSGKPGPPVPLALAPEALQAEIVHVLTTWEAEVRAVCRLSAVPVRGVAAPWHTTVTKLSPPARVRPGAAVQRAVAVLAPRMDVLARVAPVTVYRTGADGDSFQTPVAEDVAGWEAVLHLSRLHARARSMLGRTRRTFLVPGSCSFPDPDGDPEKCCGGALFRDEPRFAEDPCDVYCGRCEKGRWTADQYDRYVGSMLALPAPRTALVAA
jgi:hypothetical protein